MDGLTGVPHVLDESREGRESGWSPKVVSLGTKTVTGRTTVGVYVVEDKGSQLFVFDRKNGSTIAQGHENDVSPTIRFSK